MTAKAKLSQFLRTRKYHFHQEKKTTTKNEAGMALSGKPGNFFDFFSIVKAYLKSKA